MLIWLLGVAIFVLLWGALWRTSAKGGFGVLVGLPVAWLLSRLLTPYVTGMETIPIWLPPLPLALIAVTLFVFGAIIWFKADNLPPPKQREDDTHGHH
jgi:hypothetical protein